MVAFISADSPHFAALTADRIIKAVERVSEFPRVGRVVPEYDDEAIREVLWQSYRIVYHVGRDRVSILAVVHGARLLGEVRERLEN